MKKPLLAALCVQLIAACQQAEPPKAVESSPTLQRELADTKKQLEDLRGRVYQVEMENRVKHDRYNEGVFDPGDSSYQRVDAPQPIGAFAVSLDDVRPLGDGVKVTISLGNPLFVSYSGVKAKLTYGPRMPDPQSEEFFDKYEGWQKSLRTKEETIMQDVKAGSWNRVQVALPGIPADRFGYLKVSLETSVIKLAN